MVPSKPSSTHTQVDYVDCFYVRLTKTVTWKNGWTKRKTSCKYRHLFCSFSLCNFELREYANHFFDVGKEYVELLFLTFIPVSLDCCCYYKHANTHLLKIWLHNFLDSSVAMLCGQKRNTHTILFAVPFCSARTMSLFSLFCFSFRVGI